MVVCVFHLKYLEAIDSIPSNRWPQKDGVNKQMYQKTYKVFIIHQHIDVSSTRMTETNAAHRPSDLCDDVDIIVYFSSSSSAATVKTFIVSLWYAIAGWPASYCVFCPYTWLFD